MVRIKRVYADPASADGYRVLVDRVWPRGVSKEYAQLDEWLKEVAPTTELRRWFGHESSRWPEFRVRYEAELDQNDAVATLRRLVSDHRSVTLLYSARDEEHNQAVVLRDYLS